MSTIRIPYPLTELDRMDLMSAGLNANKEFHAHGYLSMEYKRAHAIVCQCIEAIARAYGVECAR